MKNTSHLPSQTFSRTSRQAGAFLLGAMTLLSAVCMDQTAGVFERYDKNSDGRVNRDELPNRAIFAQFDLDADGAITRAEYEKVASGENSEPRTGKAAMAQIDALAREFDRDGDGRITRAEAGGAKWFGRVAGRGPDGIGLAARCRQSSVRRSGSTTRGHQSQTSKKAAPVASSAVTGSASGSSITRPRPSSPSPWRGG